MKTVQIKLGEIVFEELLEWAEERDFSLDEVIKLIQAYALSDADLMDELLLKEVGG